MASSQFHPSVNRVRAGSHLFLKPHNYLPGLNLHSGTLSTASGSEDDLIKFYQPFPLKSSCPVPLLPPNCVKASVLNNLDPSSLLVKEKFIWKKKYRLTKSAARTFYEKNEGFKDMIDSVPLDSNPDQELRGFIPFHVSKLVALYEDDPDCHFKGHYNWYYGSTLSVTKSKKDSLFVLSAAGKSLDELHIKIVSPLKTETFVSTDQMIKGFPIYEVSTLRKRKFFTVRQRHRSVFLEFGNNTMKTLLCVDSKTPFQGVDASPSSKSEVCMIKTNKAFQVWDIESSTKNPKLTGQLPTDFYTEDNWCNLRYGGQSNLLLAADRVNIYLFDTRMDLSKPANQWNPWGLCEVCEEVSLLRPSVVSPVHCYVGTSHQMFSLDLRASFCQRWTHMMRHPPYIATCQRKSDTEVVLFSSQFVPGVECIVNDWTSVENPVSRVFPKILPSVLDTYEKAQLAGACNHPIVECRFDNHTTGLSAVKNKDGFILFTGQSSGDIFHQTLSFSEDGNQPDPELTESEVKTLKQFEKKCCKKFVKEKKTLNVTKNPVNFQGLVEKLHHKEVKAKDPKRLAQSKTMWQMPKSLLENCQDYLASRLLNAWNIKELPDWSIKPTTENEPEMMHSWPKVIPPLPKKEKPKRNKKKKKKTKTKDLEERSESVGTRKGNVSGSMEGNVEQQEERKELTEKAQKSEKKKKDKRKEAEIEAEDKEDDTEAANQHYKNQKILAELNTSVQKQRRRNVNQTFSTGISQKSDVHSPEKLRSPSIPALVSEIWSPKRLDSPRITAQELKMRSPRQLCSSRLAAQESKICSPLHNPSVPSEILGLRSPQHPCGSDITSQTSKMYCSGQLHNAETHIKRSLSPDMFDATYIIPDRSLPDGPISDSSTTSGFETDNTSIKRLKRSRKANKSNLKHSSSSSNSLRKNSSQNLESSASLLENVNLVLSPNSKTSFQQPSFTSQQTPQRHLRMSLNRISGKQKNPENADFLDENNDLEFLTPAATSTQAVSENRSAFTDLALSQPSSFADSQTQSAFGFEGQGGMNQLELMCSDYAPAVLSQPVVSRKRMVSNSKASPMKDLRLSQSYTPGF